MSITVGNSSNKDSEVHITWDDQNQINCFARNNARLSDVKTEIEAKKKEMENYKDAVDELMLLQGEEESIPYLIGEAFFCKSIDEATEKLENRQKEIEAEIKELKAKEDQLQLTLSDLKIKLYAKFGTSINLENDEE